MPGIDVTHPDVAAQWHPTLNGDLTPADVTAGCHAKAWWKCPNKCSEGCEHVWETVIRLRCLRNYGCPYCSTPIKKVCKHTSIAYLYPDIMKQWHPTLNNDLDPTTLIAGSDTKVWWICPKICEKGCPHIWQTAIKLRCLKNYGCPYCSNQKMLCKHVSIEYTHSNVSKEWHPTKNKLNCSEFLAGSDEYAWWLCQNTCPKGCLHEWKVQIKHRCLNNLKCPYCSNQKVSCEHVSLLATHPILCKEWHIKNNTQPSQYSHGSGKKVWWKCDKNHEWQAIISSRSKGNGCPYCLNKTEAKLLKYLITTHPDTQPQFRPPWCKSPITDRKLPFDFYIPSLKLIIELDGPQHFGQISNWNSCESTRKKDVFKMRAAFKQGLSVVRILQEDVLAATDEWLNETLLPHLVLHTEPDCTFIVNDEQPDIYDDHQRLLEGDEEGYAESVESEEADAV